LSPPPFRTDSCPQNVPAQSKHALKGHGGKAMMDNFQDPAPEGKPYLAPLEKQSWPVVQRMPLNLMRDDVSPPLASPSILDDTPLMFRLQSDNRESDGDSEEDTCTPVKREHDCQQCSEAFQHSQPGYILGTIGVWIPEFGGNVKE